MQILVVEDHQDTREVLTGLLKRWGHDVYPADSLKSGMDRLDNEPPVDVILSDIALPDGTGYALVRSAPARETRASHRLVRLHLSERRPHRQAHGLRPPFNQAVR